MHVNFAPEDMRPLIEAVVAETLTHLKVEQAGLRGRMAYPEAEAAALLGVERHVLRDARLRGEIGASRVGRRIVYSPDDLAIYLRRTRNAPVASR